MANRSEGAPTCLADLKTGSTFPGDKDESDDKEILFITKPEWYNEKRFKRGQAFIKSYRYGVLIAYLFALLVGFTIDSLTNALVFTGRSVGPAKARRRYIHTVNHLLKWHEGGDIFDPDSPAGRSILCVRHMHQHVRKAMSKENLDNPDRETQDEHNPGNCPANIPKFPPKALPINQYDMSLVQSGFVGVILIQPEECGISANNKEMEDYTYFWRVIGWCLGVRDEYNVCGLNHQTALNISKQIRDQIVIPGLKHPTPHFNLLSGDFVKGMRWVLLGLNQPAVHKYLYPKFGLPPPTLQGLQWLYYWELVMLGKLCYHFQIFSWLIDIAITYFLKFAIWLYS